MPFGTRTPDDGTQAVPPTRFGIMGDPDTHKDLKKPNPMTTEVIAEAGAAHEQEEANAQPAGQAEEN